MTTEQHFAQINNNDPDLASKQGPRKQGHGPEAAQ
jgi:hypothetical protein